MKLDQLQAIGLCSFVPPIRILIEHFRGIEELLDAAECAPPAQEIEAIVAQLVAMPRSDAAHTLRSRLSGLSTYQMAIGDTSTADRWDRLSESLSVFARRTGPIIIWRDDGAACRPRRSEAG